MIRTGKHGSAASWSNEERVSIAREREHLASGFPELGFCSCTGHNSQGATWLGVVRGAETFSWKQEGAGGGKSSRMVMRRSGKVC